MKSFTCLNCGHLLFFSNVRCERCTFRLGYLPEDATLVPLVRDGERWRLFGPDTRFTRFCANARHDACNWLIPAQSDSWFCRACRHNGTIPDLSRPTNLLHWQKLELAKHHLFYSLLRLGLPLVTRAEDPSAGLVFEFLADPTDEGGSRVMTGHDNGRIVIALAEADDAEREKRRVLMGEPYRTLLGHFRHEVGHYYWDRLVRDGGKLQACRAAFGDEREDYGAALQRHYAAGPPHDWQGRFVSAYATTHPWEDFAETWAHYLHIVDTLEMVGAMRLRVTVGGSVDRDIPTQVDFDPYTEDDLGRMVDAWLPLTVALNSVSRCMGQGDLYPFVLSPAVVAKFDFIHDLVRGRVAADRR